MCCWRSFVPLRWFRGELGFRLSTGNHEGRKNPETLLAHASIFKYEVGTHTPEWSKYPRMKHPPTNPVEALEKTPNRPGRPLIWMHSYGKPHPESSLLSSHLSASRRRNRPTPFNSEYNTRLLQTGKWNCNHGRSMV